MKTKNLVKSIAISVIVSAILVGCGSSNDETGNTTITPPPASSTALTIVDPYIQDAVMYWDKNNNGTFDSGEQTSTPTSKYGACTFTPALADGAKVAMKSKGIHNGVPFDGSLTANISGTGIVSPMTTLLEKFDGDTTAVLNLLTTAGITLTAADLTKDPMSGLDSASATLDDDVKKIQASVAINTFLEVIGTSSNKAAIENASATLKKSVDFATAAITSAHISSSAGIDSAINSAVAIANYITTKVKSGDTATLDTLSTDASSVDTLMTALTAKYDADSTKSFGLDATKPIADAGKDIGEVKSMTAQQYFEFIGQSLSMEYSGGHSEGTYDYYAQSDNNRSDDINPQWINYDKFSTNGDSLNAMFREFSWNWDNNVHLKSSNNIVATLTGTFANGSVDGSSTGIERDGTEYSATFKGTFKTDGNAHINSFTETRNSQTNVNTDKEIFISAVKVTHIAGVPVGEAGRDIYKVKTKSQYGLMDGNNFVASGDGYEDTGYNCPDMNITQYTQNLIDFNATADGSGNSKLVFSENGKFTNSDTHLTVADVHWSITSDVLQVRAYSDYDTKIVNNKCVDNWIGDTEWTFTGVTPTEAKSIIDVLVRECKPNCVNPPLIL